MKKKSKKISFLSILFSLLAIVVVAQEEGGNPDSGFYYNLSGYLIGIIGALVIASSIGLLVNLLSQIVKLREIEIYKEKGWEEYLEVKKENETSWWQSLKDKLIDRVPVEKEEEILFDHEYDGIRELDNNLPPWWVYGFYLSIAVSVFYIYFYHFSSYAKSSQELYAIEMQEAQEATERYLSSQSNRIDESNVELLTDIAALNDGKSVYNAYCIACHMESGGSAPGGVGPNLTDEYWIHGGDIKSVFKTIKYGVPEKGMIPWQDQLRPSEIQSVASYILSLQGTNPPNAKEPQGELYVPEKTVETDSIAK